MIGRSHAPFAASVPERTVNFRMFSIAAVTQPRMMEFTSRAMYRERKPRRKAAGFPPYRSSTSSMSVMTPARRQRRAETKTVTIPPSANAHQNQFPATPLRATSPVTASGVSAAKVVATMEVPAIHQGSDRPERKYSSRLEPARFLYARPMARESAKYEAMRIQSMGASGMRTRGMLPYRADGARSRHPQRQRRHRDRGSLLRHRDRQGPDRGAGKETRRRSAVHRCRGELRLPRRHRRPLPHRAALLERSDVRRRLLLGDGLRRLRRNDDRRSLRRPAPWKLRERSE